MLDQRKQLRVESTFFPVWDGVRFRISDLQPNTVIRNIIRFLVLTVGVSTSLKYCSKLSPGRHVKN